MVILIRLIPVLAVEGITARSTPEMDILLPVATPPRPPWPIISTCSTCTLGAC